MKEIGWAMLLIGAVGVTLSSGILATGLGLEMLPVIAVVCVGLMMLGIVGILAGGKK